MTLASGIDGARLTVMLDIRWPFSYLALQPSSDLARALGVEINWLPLRVPPLKAPSEPGPDDDRGVRHRRYRAEALAREVETYARIQGLVLREPYRDPDPAAFELGWLWTRDRHPDRLPAFLDAGFRAYWAVALDPSSETQVSKLVEASGGEAREFLAWCRDDGPSAARQIDDDLRGRGLYGAPGYVVEDEILYGRQHLPFVRWILEGRRGPVPI